MAAKTSLMEWLEQTKRISKMVDYITLDVFDSVLKSLWFIELKVLVKHKKLINELCEQYHKPNPIELIKSSSAVAEHFKMVHKISLNDWIDKNVKDKRCVVSITKNLGKCPVIRLSKHSFSDFIDGSLYRCERGRKDVMWQWWEVIDFMYERPELIDPKLIDPYIEQKINEVCSGHRKNNPLTNGHRKKFGKMWWNKIEKKWKPEKRNRF